MSSSENNRLEESHKMQVKKAGIIQFFAALVLLLIIGCALVTSSQDLLRASQTASPFPATSALWLRFLTFSAFFIWLIVSTLHSVVDLSTHFSNDGIRRWHKGQWKFLLWPDVQQMRVNEGKSIRLISDKFAFSLNLNNFADDKDLKEQIRSRLAESVIVQTRAKSLFDLRDGCFTPIIIWIFLWILSLIGNSHPPVKIFLHTLLDGLKGSY